MLYLNLATSKDLPDILELIRDLFDASTYSLYSVYNPIDVKKTVQGIIRGGQETGSVILLKEDKVTIGLLICSSFSPPYNFNDKTAAEIAFWIDPKKKTIEGMKKLLTAYRYWARHTGCSTMLVGKLGNQNFPETYRIIQL